jgi:predicted nucleic acid-binding Zn ribbon protein
MEMLQTTECFLCGYGMVYTGCRFCSDRCREAFDAGHSRLDPNQARASLVLPLDGWQIVAGPTTSPIGTSYYAPLLAHAEAGRQRQKVRNGLRSINSIPVKKRQARSRACKGTFAEGRSAAGAGQ